MPVYSTLNGSLVKQDEYLARQGSPTDFNSPLAMIIDGNETEQKLRRGA